MDRILVIPDIHGMGEWRQLVEPDEYDRIVFLGDYFDSFNIKYEEQVNNFKDILQFKTDNADKVILLIGNHDFHYLKGVNENYSGFQSTVSYQIQALLEEAIEENKMQLCYLNNKFLFSHAGFTKTWLKETLKMTDFKVDGNFVIDINEKFNHNRGICCFKYGRNFSNTGDDVTQSPIWVRPDSLYKDFVEGIVQIVGHTVIDSIRNICDTLYFVDTLQTSKEYLTISEDGTININEWNF